MTTLVPPWIPVGKSLLGTTEKRGSGNDPTIMKWKKVIGGDTAKIYSSDSIPWCSYYVQFVMAETGIAITSTDLMALSWMRWGKKLDAPCYGAILCFKRDGGGHVGFYISEDATYYHILGGNQSDAVTITKVAKSRCVGFRWPTGEQFDKFYKPGRIKTTLAGSISRNEA